VIGERWRIGTVELEVCQPRQPCSKLGLRFGNPKMVKLFAQSSRPGAYLRIVTEGELGAGDEVEVLSRPDHGVTIAMVSDAVFKDRSLIERVLVAPELSAEAVADLTAHAA
jgi:MOSC domain-containing protein YiiM